MYVGVEGDYFRNCVQSRPVQCLVDPDYFDHKTNS